MRLARRAGIIGALLGTVAIIGGTITSRKVPSFAPAPTVDPAGFYHVTHAALSVHVEDNSSPVFLPWTPENYETFLAEAEPLVLWLESKNIPLNFEPVPDFIDAVMSGSDIDGKNFIMWSADHGVVWDPRAHANGRYNAADTAAKLEAAGYPFNGVLGSYENPLDYAGAITSTGSSPVQYRFSILSGYGLPDHTETTFMAGVISQGDQAVVLGGRQASFAHTTPVYRNVLSGKLKAGVVKPTLAGNGRRDGKAGPCATAWNADKTGSGVSAKTAMERSLADAPGVKYQTLSAIVADWRASGGADYTYDAATIR